MGCFQFLVTSNKTVTDIGVHGTPSFCGHMLSFLIRHWSGTVGFIVTIHYEKLSNFSEVDVSFYIPTKSV